MKRWIILVASLGILSLVAAHAAPRGGDISVGVTVSLTGKYAKFGKEELNGIQMWVEDLNSRGALLGRKVRVVHYDDKSDRKESARLYERLITKDRVDLLLGPYSSGLTLAASDVAEKHQFPMLTTGAASSKIWARGYKNIFGLETPAIHYMDLVVELLHKGGVDRIGLFYAGTDFPREVAEGVRTQAAKYGLTIVFDEEYNKDSTTFSDLVGRMARTQPEVVIGGTYLKDSVAFVRAAKKSSLSPKAYVFTVGPAVREFGDKLGTDAEGMMGVVQWIRSARIPKAQDFSYRYKEKYGYNAGQHAVYGYGAGQTLEAAVRLAGSLDKDKLREQLRTLKFRSLFGHYRVDENGMQVAKKSLVLQWQDDRRRLVLPKRLAERPVRLPVSP